MKKWICLLLAALTACLAFAAAENVTAAGAPQGAEAALDPEAAMAGDLAKMIPVLDSFARTIDTEGETTYDAGDPAFVWTQLYLLGANWYQEGQLEAAEAALSTISVPADRMNEFAAASFADLEELPDFPETKGFMIFPVSYDAEKGEYVLVASDPAPTYVMIERYAETGLEADPAAWSAAPAGEEVPQAATLVGFGLYDGETNLRQCGFTATLVAEEKAGEDIFAASPELEGEEVTEPRFPYAVKDVRPEADDDFEGLDVTSCAIRYEEPEAEEAPAPEPAAQSRYVELARGNRGEDVRLLQARLNGLGYACGSEDGIFGPRTWQAVRYFQDAIGFAQTGAASPELQERLFAADAPTYAAYVTLRRGSSGVRVEKLQTLLRDLGYLSDPVDGVFGPRTEKAVKLFQNAVNLREDGIAGIKTLSALENKNAPACETYIDLYRGDTGIRVTEMQKQLIKLGLLTGKPSGCYDKKTAEAVSAFMKARGISGDGSTMASAATIAAMFQAPTPTPDPDPTATPDPDPTVTPDPDPTATPDPDPTATPDPDPTVTPDPDPTATPDPDPTATPEPDPTATPEPDPTATPEPDPVSVLTKEELDAFVATLNTLLGEQYDEKQAVTWLQESLEVAQPNGVYNAATQQAVTAFQKEKGFEETGLADEATLQALIDSMKN